MAPVALTVEPPCGDSRVQLGRVHGDGLQQVEHVQVEHELALQVGPVQCDAEPVPQARPGGPVAREQGGQPGRGAGQLIARTELDGSRRRVTGGDHRDGLVDHHRARVQQIELEPLGVAAFVAGLDDWWCTGASTGDAGRDRRGDADPALGGLGHDQQDISADLFAGDGTQVPVGQTAVLSDVVVDDPGVDPGAHADLPVPAVGDHGGLQGSQVGPVHRHDAPLDDAQSAACRVEQQHPAGQHPVAKIQLPMLVCGAEPPGRPPRAVTDA